MPLINRQFTYSLGEEKSQGDKLDKTGLFRARLQKFTEEDLEDSLLYERSYY